MNLGQFSVEELLLAAIKSEVESKDIYTKLADKIKNGLIKDKFYYLASEEEKHRQYIEEVYLNHFPDQQIRLPKETPVPLPEIHMDEDTPISKILKEAMVLIHRYVAVDLFRHRLRGWDRQAGRVLLRFCNRHLPSQSYWCIR